MDLKWVSLHVIFVPNAGNSLTLVVKDFGAYTSSVDVVAFGAGVDRERNVSYDFDELKKLDARIKRLVRNAQKEAVSKSRRMEQNNEKYDTIVEQINKRKVQYDNIEMCTITGAAEVKVNGHTITANEELQVQVSIGDAREYVDIETAIQILNMLPEGAHEE